MAKCIKNVPCILGLYKPHTSRLLAISTNSMSLLQLSHAESYKILLLFALQATYQSSFKISALNHEQSLCQVVICLSLTVDDWFHTFLRFSYCHCCDLYQGSLMTRRLTYSYCKPQQAFYCSQVDLACSRVCNTWSTLKQWIGIRNTNRLLSDRSQTFKSILVVSVPNLMVIWVRSVSLHPILGIIQLQSRWDWSADSILNISRLWEGRTGEMELLEAKVRMFSWNAAPYNLNSTIMSHTNTTLTYWEPHHASTMVLISFISVEMIIAD